MNDKKLFPRGDASLNHPFNISNWLDSR